MTTLVEPETTNLDLCVPGDPASWSPAERLRNEQMSAFLRVMEEEGMILAACKAVGLQQSTVWRWRDKYPAFAEAIERIKTQRVTVLEENLYRIAASTDPKMAMAAVRSNEILLRAWEPDVYTERRKIEASQTINEKIQIAIEVRDRFRAERQAKLAEIRTINAELATALAMNDG